MGKTIIFGEDRILKLKENMASINDTSHKSVCVNEARPEADEFELGQESDNPPLGGNYCHVNESYGQSNMDKIDYIYYVPHDNPREEGYTADNITEFTPYYELECYSIDKELIFEGELTLNELFDYFPDKIIHALSNREGRKVSQSQWMIEDILSWDTTPKDINDVEEVNAIAKRIQTGGKSSYILTDGEVISFHDHINITSIDGMTPSKFVGLGNIRIGIGGSIEVSKEPNQQQISVLKDFIRREDEVYLDIVQDCGKMYPTAICSAAYQNPNPNRVINDIIYYFTDGVKPMGSMRYESKKKYKNLIENIDFEVDSSEIDLSSFKKKTNLAPIWDENELLDSRVRLRLLDIADDFWEFVNLTWVKPSGIILTGSICNFNWSQFSDIDLHLIVDFDEIDEKTDFVRDYLDSKKNEWNNEHSELTIMGFQVELYVQNLGEMPQSGGIYDIEENDWVKKPSSDDIKPIGLDKFSIKDKAAEIMTIIDDMYDVMNSTEDSHEINSIGEDARYLWKKVKKMRKTSLEKNGESGSGNVVYKYLRRSGYLDKLWKLSSIIYDRVNSINESVENNGLSLEDYEKAFNQIQQELNVFTNSVSEKYGNKFWFSEPLMKHHPEIKIDPIDIEKRKTLIAKYDKIKAEWQKAIENTEQQEKLKQSEATLDIIKLAIDEFGTTNDIHQGGYILPNGQLLNLGNDGYRDVDHRQIAAVYTDNNIKIWDDSYRYNYVVDFMNHGAIRCDVNCGILDMTKEPTNEQYQVLKTFIAKTNDVDIDFTNTIGDTICSVSYSNAKPQKIIADIYKYYNEGIKPLGNVRESKKIIKEYLEKNNNYPLYGYFKWAENASSCEKADDLAYKCSYYIDRYIEKICYDYEDFNDLLNENGDFDYEDETQIEAFLKMLEQYNLCDHFISIMQDIINQYGDYRDLPTWCSTSFNRIVKNEWCIHFTSDSENIARYGFTGGTEEIDSLAYTSAGAEKPFEGYNFAFLINDRSVDFNNYGEEAVIFRTSGVEIYHYGDEQNQVIFWGPNVREIIPIHQDNGDWVVYGLNGQILVRCDEPSKIAFWATENLPQYRKQIMTGKNGYIPKYYDYNQKKRVPYPLYKNESVKRYITLLKENKINEEWVGDGNSEHNPYKKRWDAERKALKDFVSNYGKLMQSKENGKLYKCYYDKTLSQLIGYNYCICIQWDSIEMKPKSVLYIRALDKFTPNIKQVNFDVRGRDNLMGTRDDLAPRINYGNT